MAKSKPTFENAMKRVEQIVDAIEQGKVGLENSIKQFEEGMKLIQHCRQVLSDAELKIQKLQTGPDGRLKTEPMDPPTER
ncbi:MAG: exodeoxyribonuclease VII small subunit [Phycisphaerae bacterium]